MSEGYEAIETASIDKLRTLQLDRLRWSLLHAYDNVAHYRASFDSAGVHPSEVADLDDLSRFPFLVKEDLRATYPFGMLAVPRDQVVRVHASSGTTGQATVGGYTKNDIEVWSTVMARSLFAAGVRPGDVAHVAYGYGLFTGGLGAHYGAEKLGCMVVPVSGGQTERQVQLIHDLRPRVILVTPSYFLNVLDEMKNQGIDPRECSLEIGIFGAEPWTDSMRAEIERRAKIDAVDIYGLTEVIGPGVAQECVETKDGLTVWEDHFYPEIIDPDTGQVLPDGEEGELVLTSLTKEAFPVIRYRTRDRTTLLAGTARTMRRMAKVTGRTDDMLIIRGVNVFPSQIEHEVLKVEGLAPHYQLVVSTEGNLARLDVLVELEPGVDERRLASELEQLIKSNVGVAATVKIGPVGSVTRSAGKAQRVIDRRADR